jgi:hypothetical protein
MSALSLLTSHNKVHQFGKKIEKKLQVANYKSIMDQQVENFKVSMQVANYKSIMDQQVENFKVSNLSYESTYKDLCCP